MSVAARSGDIPLTVLPLGAQRYSCHGCGLCCRDFTVQLRPADLEKLRAQGWERTLGVAPVVEFRGQSYLRQREDGACVFLQEDGRCRIHAEHGLEAKPLACQFFPFILAPQEHEARVAISFACRSVQENRGAPLASHLREVRAMAAQVPELAPARTLLDPRTPAQPQEEAALVDAADRWLRDARTPLAVRLDGLAFLAQALGAARFERVRGPRFQELVDLLVRQLPEELPLQPVEEPTRAQRATLRQAAFFRLEDPKIGAMARMGRLRSVLSQFRRSRAFARGRGAMPPTGDAWPAGARLEAVESAPGLLDSPDLPAVDELLTRWLRATVLGGRAWGSGYYGWPMTLGLQAIALNAACALWLARAHAVAAGRAMPTLEDARAAVGRVDRAAGRAPWIGSRAEALRLRYLLADDGLRRIMRAAPPHDAGTSAPGTAAPRSPSGSS